MAEPAAGPESTMMENPVCDKCKLGLAYNPATNAYEHPCAAQPSAEGDGLLPQELVEGIAWWKDGKNANSFSETGLRDFIDALIENLPRKGAEGDGWIAVTPETMPDLDADNCCMDEGDYGRYSNPVLVFDEDYGRSLVASFDGRKNKWHADNGDILREVTHWRPLPAPVAKEGRES